MERIERALEVARLHRQHLAEVSAPPLASVSAVPPPAPPAAASPSFAEVLAEPGTAPRFEDAREVALPARDILRERYVVFPDEPGQAALAYQMLRTQVLQHARAHGMRCIGVISAANGEGKTVTAVNLALSLAAAPNQNVMLVDLDLKRPSIAATLGLEVQKGVEAHLTDGEPLGTLCYRLAGVDRLAVLPASQSVPGSAELLAGASAAALFRTLRAMSGDPLLIVDLPPALLSADVLAVAPQLDGVVLVVTEERTRREDIQRVFELLRSTPVVGTVLNASAEAEARSY